MNKKKKIQWQLCTAQLSREEITSRDIRMQKNIHLGVVTLSTLPTDCLCSPVESRRTHTHTQTHVDLYTGSAVSPPSGDGCSHWYLVRRCFDRSWGSFVCQEADSSLGGGRVEGRSSQPLQGDLLYHLSTWECTVSFFIAPDLPDSLKIYSHKWEAFYLCPLTFIC